MILLFTRMMDGCNVEWVHSVNWVIQKGCDVIGYNSA